MVPAAQPSGRVEVLRRATVTVGAVLLSFALGYLPLPFTEGLQQAFGPAASATLSVGALGVRPLVTAAVLVELLALIVPALRRRRHAGWAARRPLAAAAWLGAAALAAVQATGMARFLGVAQAYGEGLVIGRGQLWVVGLTVVAGALLCAGLAEAITRRGLGNGFAVLSAAGVLAGIWSGLRGAGGVLQVLDPVLPVLIFAAVAVASARLVGRRSEALVSVPAPTCGAIPLDLAAALLLLPFTLANLFPALQPLLHEEQAYGLPFQLAGLALVVLLALALSALFARRRAVEAAWRRADPGIEPAQVAGALRAARRRSLAMLAALGLLPVLAAAASRAWSLGLGRLAAAVVLGVAIADLAADVRARLAAPGLVPAYPLHRVHALEAALHALAAAGIPAVARNRGFRTLLQFFGPYAPIELCVPPARAEEAAALCARVVGGIGADGAPG